MNKSMPATLSQEKPAANLASLVTGDSLQQLTSSLISHWRKRSQFKDVLQFGIRPLDRALFYGPPGNGKTMSAQVVAQNLGCPLYRVRCESLLDSAFGQTQKNLTEVMDWLERQDLAVVLWDECETIFPTRAGGASDACTQALVNTMQLFWQRLDRWQSPQVFLLATNLIERLDAALLSRIELQIEFGPPTKDQALKVLEYWREVLHAYDPDSWGATLQDRIEGGQLPTSFRELWQTISCSVRDVIVAN